MRKGRAYGIVVLIFLLVCLCFTACGKTSANSEDDKATPSIAPEISKMSELKDISVLLDGISAMLGIENYPNMDSLELTVQIKNMDDEKQSAVLEETYAVLP